MILFIAPNPEKHEEREGYLQRVASIDLLFDGYEKRYSSDCGSEEELAQLLIDAELIYVHSIYRAEEIIDCYPIFGDKIITDLHGIVPEEELLRGEVRRSKELEAVESKVFAHCRNFVAVTRAMVEHFKTKYQQYQKNIQWVVLPIFDNNIHHEEYSKSNTVLYSGGAQSWQNVGMIVDAINTLRRKYDYTILTHDLAAFEDISEDMKDCVLIKSVKSNELEEYYKSAKYGFILREDVNVNNVACPTKLIDYLCNGVVPVVKSPNIGDFAILGYKYITYTDLLSKRQDDDLVKSYARHNYGVVRKLMKMTQAGKKSLLMRASKIIDQRIKVDHDVILVASACKNAKSTKELNAANYQISEQIKIIEEYAESVRYLKKEANNLKKGWKDKLINKGIASYRNISKNR